MPLPWRAVLASYFDAGAGKPQDAENSALKNKAPVEIDSAQNLGQCVHSVLRTVSKVPWPLRK